MGLRDAESVISILGKEERKPTTYRDGTVSEIKGDTAYVDVDGGAKKTPCRFATSAKIGDKVQVQIDRYSASIVGNYTSPATNDEEAKEARRIADEAYENLLSTYMAVESAEQAAIEAGNAADQAQREATAASTSAREAQTAADNATTAADTATRKAEEAIVSATNANEYAARALGHLGTVESVAETLAWITEHGTMTKTTDTIPDPSHVYFVADDNGEYVVGTKLVYQHTEDIAIDPDKTYYKLVYSYALTEDDHVVEGKTYYVLDDGEYVVVDNPVDAGIATYYERSESYEVVENPDVSDISAYYELVPVPARYSLVIEPKISEMDTYYELAIDESLQNYVGTHMALSSEGLWLMPDGYGGSRILVSTGRNQAYPAGTHIFDGISGSPVAYYGRETVIGDPNGFHILVTPNTVDGVEGLIGFYYGNNRISYISSTQLVIPRAVVVESLSVGDNWTWETASNGNLNLKWIGGS